MEFHTFSSHETTGMKIIEPLKFHKYVIITPFPFGIAYPISYKGLQRRKE